MLLTHAVVKNVLLGFEVVVVRSGSENHGCWSTSKRCRKLYINRSPRQDCFIIICCHFFTSLVPLYLLSSAQSILFFFHTFTDSSQKKTGPKFESHTFQTPMTPIAKPRLNLLPPTHLYPQQSLWRDSRHRCSALPW